MSSSIMCITTPASPVDSFSVNSLNGNFSPLGAVVIIYIAPFVDDDKWSILGSSNTVLSLDIYLPSWPYTHGIFCGLRKASLGLFLANTSPFISTAMLPRVFWPTSIISLLPSSKAIAALVLIRLTSFIWRSCIPPENLWKVSSCMFILSSTPA